MSTKAGNNDLAYQILDRAHPDFATAPVQDAFNWPAFAARTEIDGWYMVAFRSVRKPGADVAKLEELDDIAHHDAAGQPGFLFYFKGKILPGATHRKNLSFCMWETRGDARASAVRIPHRNASSIALQMYQDYILERYNAHVHRDPDRAWVEFVPAAAA